MRKLFVSLMVVSSIALALPIEVSAAFRLPWQPKETVTKPSTDVEVTSPKGNEQTGDTATPVIQMDTTSTPQNSNPTLLTQVTKGGAKVSATNPGNGAAKVTYTVKAGDNLWNLMEASLSSSTSASSTDAGLATITNALRAQDAGSLDAMGITSGNIDLIYPGQVITFYVSPGAGA